MTNAVLSRLAWSNAALYPGHRDPRSGLLLHRATALYRELERDVGFKAQRTTERNGKEEVGFAAQACANLTFRFS